jgi:hypothetical protein
MPSILAVVSKKVFEADARRDGKKLGLGDVWPTARYASAHAALRPLCEGGDILLMTVRPPDEALWLVAVLESPKFDGEGWAAKENAVPMTDATSLRAKIQFANGSGVTAEKGKLGMSLQTPRTLSAETEALLLQLSGAAAATPGAQPAASSPASNEIHFNGHEVSALPCLCKKCFRPDVVEVEKDGMRFRREKVEEGRRVLYFWMPEELASQEKEVRRAVQVRLREQHKVTS